MIITIGGEYGSGGKAVAELLAKLLGYRLCDDDIVTEASKDSDVDVVEEAFRYYDESEGEASLEELKKLSRTQGKGYMGMLSSLSLDVLPIDRRIADALEKTLNKLADEGNCILMGRCAGYYLAGRDNCVRVFVTDSEENRLQRIMKFFDTDEKSARKMIQKTNKRRADYYKFFTGKEWGDKSSYDLTLRCSLLGDEGTAQLIQNVVMLKERG